MITGHIVVVGSVNMDMMLHCRHLPGAGETVLGDSFITAPGGKGANQAIAAARLGATVAFIGCVGDDSFGRAAVDALRSEGIDTQHLSRILGAATGVAMIATDDVGENSIVLASGANALLSPAHVDAAEALFLGAAMLICQLETPLETVRHAINIAVRLGVPILLNPAPALHLPPDLLSAIDLLVPNAGEAAMLSGLTVDAKANANASGAHGAAARSAEALRLGGAKNVLVTLGGDGVVVATAQGCIHHPAVHIQAVDSTGAGDTFVGALAAARVQGVALDAATEFAQRAAAFSVTRRGAQASMPRLVDLHPPWHPMLTTA